MFIDKLAAWMGEAIFARVVLALIGIILGLLPLFFGISRKQVLSGVLGCLLCGVISTVGLPQFAILIALLATYLIHGLSGKSEEDTRNRNRKHFSGVLRKERENGKILEREYVENTGAAYSAWPPIAHTVDEEAMQACREMLQKEDERSSSTKTDAEKQTIYMEERRAK